MSPEEQEQWEYWENGVFQCLLQRKMAEEILKDHKSWGNKVRIDGDKFHAELKSKSEDKGKSSQLINDLPAAQPTVALGVTAAYVE